MARTRTNRGVYSIEDAAGEPVKGPFNSYSEADKAIGTIAEAGIYLVVCRWPEVTLEETKPKLVRAKAAPEST